MSKSINSSAVLNLSENFAEKLVDQALELGAEIEPTEVFSVKDVEVKTVITEDGDFEAKAVIIATGAKHRLLGIENEEFDHPRIRRMIECGCDICQSVRFRVSVSGYISRDNSFGYSNTQCQLLLSHSSFLQRFRYSQT